MNSFNTWMIVSVVMALVLSFVIIKPIATEVSAQIHSLSERIGSIK